MGMFNSIVSDLLCPDNKAVSKNAEIQIKWQAYEERCLDVYRVGDTLKCILPEFDNCFIRTDYICDACSKHTTLKNGMRFISTSDQKRHYVFVRIVKGRIERVMTEEEFRNTDIKDFVDYL